jgi:hypothetical protein
MADWFHGIGRRFYASEFTRMGADEQEARRIGRLTLESGADGSLNGA